MLAQLPDLAANGRQFLFIADILQGPAIQSATCSISGSLRPRVVAAGVPMRKPLVTKGRAGVEGNGILVHGDPGFFQGLLGHFTGQLAAAESRRSMQVIVGAAGDEIEATLSSALPPAPWHC